MQKFLSTFICFYTIFLSNSAISQDLNKAFLESLPKSIQEDFLSSNSDDNLSDNFNERPETRIRKVESGIDDIKGKIQSLETQINRDELKDDITIFGSNFFDSYQTSFAPINQLNFSSDYVVDVGDVFRDRRQLVGLRVHPGNAGAHNTIQAHEVGSFDRLSLQWGVLLARG